MKAEPVVYKLRDCSNKDITEVLRRFHFYPRWIDWLADVKFISPSNLPTHFFKGATCQLALKEKLKDTPKTIDLQATVGGEAEENCPLSTERAELSPGLTHLTQGSYEIDSDDNHLCFYTVFQSSTLGTKLNRFTIESISENEHYVTHEREYCSWLGSRKIREDKEIEENLQKLAGRGGNKLWAENGFFLLPGEVRQ